MVTIVSSTLRSNIWETIYDTLTAAKLLSSTVTVTSAYIDDDSAFPQVVINPVDVEKNSFTFDRTYSVKDIVILIDIWTTKNKQKDQISDEIDAIITPLKMGGVMLSGWSESNALETPGDNKLHLKTITLNYMRG